MHKNKLLLPSPIERLQLRILENYKTEVFIKRDDLIHPILGGNKWRKLKYNLEEARSQGKNTLLTFGGAYSNHIHAVAAAGNLFDFRTIGIIRGEEHQPLNPTLAFCAHQGMRLVYVSREEYRSRNDPAYLEQLSKKYDDPYIIPEGGTNALAVNGTAEIIPEINIQFDYICCAVGTGGTMAGLISSATSNQKVLGYSSLKGGDFLNREVSGLISHGAHKNWEIITDYHFGGYAKWTPELTAFIKDFHKESGMKLDPVYTSKLFFGVLDDLKNGKFKPESSIVILHSGGLQGVRGFEERTRLKLFD